MMRDEPVLAPVAGPVPTEPVSDADPVSATEAAVSPLDALTGRERTWRTPARLVMLLIACLAVWASFAHLDEVAIAQGEVVPQGNVKVIQHLEGGIVQAIHVAEGDVVQPGDALVSLELGTAGMNAQELEVQLDALRLKRARLTAEAGGEAPRFPAKIAGRRPDLTRSELATFKARQREFESGLTVLREQVRQAELAVRELEAQRNAFKADLKLARRSLGMSTDLLKDGLTSKLEHIERQREVQRLEGGKSTIEASIPKAKAALAEAQERLREETFKVRREAADELAQIEVAIARVTETSAMASDQERRAQIASPTEGVVKNLRYHTIGGVVRPGEAIMEIVPSDEVLVIEARLRPVDRGYVVVGQPATVKISTYEFIRYGGLEGTVSQIAADSNIDQGGEPYFRVIVTTERSYLGNEANRLPISPGMEATVDIHTGTRSVLEYLARPVLKLKHEAFRER